MDANQQIEACERRRGCRDDRELNAAIDRSDRYISQVRQELLPRTPAEEQRRPALSEAERIDEAFQQRLAEDASEPGRDYYE